MDGPQTWRVEVEFRALARDPDHAFASVKERLDGLLFGIEPIAVYRTHEGTVVSTRAIARVDAMEGRQATCEAGLVVQQIAHDARVEVILDRARCLGPVETYTIVPDNSRHVIDIGFKRDGTLSIGSEST